MIALAFRDYDITGEFSEELETNLINGKERARESIENFMETTYSQLNKEKGRIEKREEQFRKIMNNLGKSLEINIQHKVGGNK